MQMPKSTTATGNRAKWRYVLPYMFGLASSILAANQAVAQTWPQKNIRVIIGFAAGGTPDFAIRIVAPKLGENLGQPVIVENRPGAGASTAMEVAARAPADGYTLAVGTLGSLLFAKALFPKAAFDPITSFDPVSLFAKTNFVAVAQSSLPIKNLRDLIAYAKANPGKLSYGSSTPGSPPHIIAEMFKSQAGVDILSVTYKGSADAGAAFLGGTVQMIFDAYPTIGPLVSAGKAIPLLVTGSTRKKELPNVPTAAEAGMPDYTIESWIGLVSVAGTPEPVLRRLNSEVVRIMSTKDAQDGMEKIGLEPASNSIEQFRALVKSDWPKWNAAIKAAGVTSQ
ncbi:MAG: Bug family tripartite tricarboxylate transporter substrate binding protein [Burkholderiales bacterium]